MSPQGVCFCHSVVPEVSDFCILPRVYSCALQVGGWRVEQMGLLPALPRVSSTADGPSCPMAWAGWCQGGLSQLAWAVGERGCP